MYGVCHVRHELGGFGGWAGIVLRRWWNGRQWSAAVVPVGPFAQREDAEAFVAECSDGPGYFFVYAAGDPFGDRQTPAAM